MLAWTDRKRAYKDQYRKFAVLNAKPAKVYLTLPSDSIADIILAVELGTIDSKTFVIAVEKDAKKAKTIKEKLKAFNFKHHVHHGELHTLPLEDILKQYKLKSVDLAFFDLCGQMTCQVARWIMRLNPSTFSSKAKVAWTFSTIIRKNLLLDWLNRADDADATPIKSDAWDGRGLVDGAIDKCRYIGVGRSGESDGTFFSLYSLFGALTNNWLFNFDRIHEYNDSSPMVYIETTIRGISKVLNGVTRNVDLSISSANPPVNVKSLRPPGMSPARWSWCVDNPNGRRAA